VKSVVANMNAAAVIANSPDRFNLPARAHSRRRL
jgi:hypothetical protein